MENECLYLEHSDLLLNYFQNSINSCLNSFEQEFCLEEKSNLNIENYEERIEALFFLLLAKRYNHAIINFINKINNYIVYFLEDAIYDIEWSLKAKKAVFFSNERKKIKTKFKRHINEEICSYESIENELSSFDKETKTKLRYIWDTLLSRVGDILVEYFNIALDKMQIKFATNRNEDEEWLYNEWC